MVRIHKFAIVLIEYSFYTLFFGIPLILFPKTTEIFEFNKTIFLFFCTTSVTLGWIIRCLVEKKFVLKSNVYAFGIILFLASQVISIVNSVDVYTSLHGYHGRYNGGLYTLIAFSLLTLAYLSNMDRRKTIKSIRFILVSSLIVSGYALAQRLGVDDHIWAQDVVYRVFSTFGQPNWLAAWVACVAPLGVVLFALSQRSWYKALLFVSPAIYTLVLLLTKSRSGLLGLVIGFLITAFYLRKIEHQSPHTSWRKFITSNLVLVAITIALIGSPWTPQIKDLNLDTSVTSQIYDRRGTETIQTRRYVWKTAIEIAKDYPLTGTGPETFAYMFAVYRPIEHNTSIEWDHVFNKAHNEYLNYLSNTGFLGLIGYLLFITSAFATFYRTHRSKSKEAKIVNLLNAGALGGFVSLLVTNTFGFSTIPTNLMLFIFPAFSYAVRKNDTTSKLPVSFLWQIPLIGLSFFAYFIVILLIARFWIADYMIATAQKLNNEGEYASSVFAAELALTLGGNPTHVSSASKIYAEYALSQYFDNPNESNDAFTRSINLSDAAIHKSPNNFLLNIDRANLFLKLAPADTDYLDSAIVQLTSLSKLTPNDPKIWYNLGLAIAKKGNFSDAKVAFAQSISLKSDYKPPRHGIILICQQLMDRQCQIDQATYIVNFIDPTDKLALQILEKS